MQIVSKVIFWIFLAIAALSLIASLFLCADDAESKNARKTALWSMIIGLVLTYLSWILWSL